jgi:hypothetical protein
MRGSDRDRVRLVVALRLDPFDLQAHGDVAAIRSLRSSGSGARNARAWASVPPGRTRCCLSVQAAPCQGRGVIRLCCRVGGTRFGTAEPLIARERQQAASCHP